MCDRCDSLTDLRYFLEGDGDGVEFLVERAARSGREEFTSVMLRHRDVGSRSA